MAFCSGNEWINYVTIGSIKIMNKIQKQLQSYFEFKNDNDIIQVNFNIIMNIYVSDESLSCPIDVNRFSNS